MKWPFNQRGKAQAAAFLTFQTWSWEADSATVSALRVAGSWGTSQYEKMDAHGSTERLLVHSKRFYDECTDFPFGNHSEVTNVIIHTFLHLILNRRQ